MAQDVKLKDPGTCRIFFSSPFGGMELEREELTKKYFPQIHHACNGRGIKFVPVDMRWGITKEAAENAQVMNICLREVERSDFFVGFFGQRYGWHSIHSSDSMLLQNFENARGTYPWVDKFQDRSMTEIECRAGHLNNPGRLPSCFCFRDKVFDDHMHDQGLKNNDSSQVMKYKVENEFADGKLKGLIQEVVDSKDKTWGVQLNCKDPQEMAKFIFETLWKFLTDVVLKEQNEEEIPYLLQQRIVHDQFVTSASHIYCGCVDYLAHLMKKVDEPSTKGTVVRGPAGCGKSALLAKLMLSLQQAYSDIVVIYHFIGCASGTERPRTILERILLELKESFPKLQPKTPIPADENNEKNQTNSSSNSETLKNSTRNIEKPKSNSGRDKEVIESSGGKCALEEKKSSEKDGNISGDSTSKSDNKELEKKEEGKSGLEKKTDQQILSEVILLMKEISESAQKVVIILDALNQQISMDKTIKHLYWLPECFPDGITFICSTLDSDTASHDLLVMQRGMDTLMIDPFGSELQKDICIETLKVAGKELSPHQLERVINSKETSNALFLKLVLYELSIYGDFSKLDEKIDSLIYVSGVKRLLQVILDRLELDYNSKDYQGNIVKDVLCCLIASRKGLTETEITEILNVPTHIWSPLFFALEHLLSHYTGLLGFAFSEMREAVQERYLFDTAQIIPYKKKLIKYYNGIKKNMKPWNKNNKPEFNRVTEELPWLQIDIDDVKGLISTLSDLSIMCKLAANNVNQLLYLWQQTNLPWSSVSALYMKTFETVVVDLYQATETQGEDKDSPGMKVRVCLQYMRIFFDAAYYSRGSEVAMEREIRILENCKSALSEEKRSEYLRDSRYYLAMAYSEQQNIDDALPLYMAVHEECQRLLKEKENNAVKEMLAFTCNGIGLIHYYTEDFTKAKEYLERSKTLHNEMKNRIHEAASTTNIGLTHLSEKKYEEALNSFHEAMQLYEEHFFGKISLDVGNLLTNIALTYRRMSNLTKAEEYYHKSLEMKAMNVGWNHPVIATAYMNLGTLEVHRKRYREAEEWTRKAISIYEVNEFPVTDKNHRMCRENLCVNMLKQGKKEELLPLYIEITHILVDNGWIEEIIVSLHREMLEFMLEKGMYKDVEKFALAILASSKRRAKFAYILADHDSKHPITQRPARPKELTLQHFLEEYPGEDSLKILYFTDVLARENRLEEIIEICENLDESKKSQKENAYSFAVDGLLDFDHNESALRIAQIGLENYPESLELVHGIVKCLICLKRKDELSVHVPALLSISDFEIATEETLIDVACSLEESHPLLSGQCYQKVLSLSKDPLFHSKAKNALNRNFPNGLPSSSKGSVIQDENANSSRNSVNGEGNTSVVTASNTDQIPELFMAHQAMNYAHLQPTALPPEKNETLQNDTDRDLRMSNQIPEPFMAHQAMNYAHLQPTALPPEKSEETLSNNTKQEVKLNKPKLFRAHQAKNSAGTSSSTLPPAKKL